MTVIEQQSLKLANRRVQWDGAEVVLITGKKVSFVYFEIEVSITQCCFSSLDNIKVFSL